MIRGVVLLLVAVVVIEASSSTLDQYRSLFDRFKKTHNKIYKTKNEERARFYIFVDNQQKIDNHNKDYQAGRVSYEMGMNQFGDMTNQEFRSIMNGYKPMTKSAMASIFQAPSNDLPSEVDWRPKGYVTPVKDQAQCGSCWAFSSTGSLEGQHFKKTGKLVSLSEQNLVDCTRTLGNEGCGGGWMDTAFKYVKNNNGIDTEVSYPYEAKDRPCRFNKDTIGATDTGFTDIKNGSESDLEAAIATVGPIAVAIDATGSGFQFYKTGVYYDPQCNPTFLDHAVLAVGYGTTTDNQKYYIVKNSWAETWGDKGYILMARERNNHCGIASAASYPDV